MAVEYGLWDSVAGDRTFDSADIATMFTAVAADGYVLGKDSECQVVQTSPVTKDVQVGLGFVFVQGRWLRIFSAAETVTVAAADATNPRIDRVAVRLDYSARTCAIVYLQGTAATTPSPPALTQTAGVTWEHPLAQIFLPANATQIYTNQADAGGTQGYVTDERRPSVVGTQGHLGTFFRTPGNTDLIEMPIPQVGLRRLLLYGRVDADPGTSVLTPGNIRFNANDTSGTYAVVRRDTYGNAPTTHSGNANGAATSIESLRFGARHGALRMRIENPNAVWVSGRLELESWSGAGPTMSESVMMDAMYLYQTGPIRTIYLNLTTGPEWGSNSYVDVIGHL